MEFGGRTLVGPPPVHKTKPSPKKGTKVAVLYCSPVDGPLENAAARG